MPTTQKPSNSLVLAEFEEFLAVLECAFEGIALWEPNPWRVAYANPAFWQLIGTPAEGLGSQVASSDNLPGFPVGMIDLLNRFGDADDEQSTTFASLDTWFERNPIEVRLCRVARVDQQIVGMVVRPVAGGPPTKRDTTNSSQRDPLTGLPDREFLMTRLRTLLEGHRVADRQFAVVFLDLDHFKRVNDDFGHLVGDEVLREAARRIASCLREGDQVVRYGGDEFVAVIEDVSVAHEVKPVICRIRMALAKPFELPRGEVTLSVSAGIALASEAGGSPEELLAVADRAMYAAKRAGTQSVGGVCDPGSGSLL